MADDILKLPTTNLAPPPFVKKEGIPIRSVNYKKSLKNPKDLEERKDLLKSLTRFATPMTTGTFLPLLLILLSCHQVLLHQTRVHQS